MTKEKFSIKKINKSLVSVATTAILVGGQFVPAVPAFANEVEDTTPTVTTTNTTQEDTPAETPTETAPEETPTNTTTETTETTPEETTETPKESVKEEIDFQTIYVPDTTKEFGYTEVTKEGVKGEKVDGEITKEPVNKVVTVGVKSSVKTEEIPFDTIRQENAALPNGTESVKQEGVKGKIVTTTTYKLNESTGEVTPTETKEETPTVNKIVEFGTRVDQPAPQPTPQPEPNTGNNTNTGTNTGNNTSSNTGTNTSSNNTNTSTPSNNTSNSNSNNNTSTNNNSNTVETPKEETKTIEVEVNVDTEIIPFNTVYEDDQDLPVGQERVKQAGVDGIKQNGSVIKQPVDKIVARGTKKVSSLDGNVNTGTEEIPFDTVYEKDDTLPLGKEEVKQEGRNGLKENGVVTREPVNKIVKVGTKTTETKTVTVSGNGTRSTTSTGTRSTDPTKAQPDTGAISSTIPALVGMFTSSLLGAVKYKKRDE